MMSLFINHIRNEALFEESDRILLAVSGGIDSIWMQHLFNVHAFRYGIVHCNFQLRGEESNKDEAFVKALALSHKVPFYSIRLDTEEYARKHKISVQMAARTLRYEWFEQIRAEEGYAYIATAHHSNDAIETILINLIRGTGIRGLHGIVPKKGKVIRPILPYTRREIEEGIKSAGLSWREDQSNASTKYLRNKIRLELIPVLKELNPSIEKHFNELVLQIRSMEPLLDKAVKEASFRVFQKEGGIISIEKQVFADLNPLIRYELFKAYGFHADTLEDILRSINHQSGACFFSDTHRILLDRNHLLLSRLEKNKLIEYTVEEGQEALDLSTHSLTFRKIGINGHNIVRTKNVASLDYSLLKFPLSVRKWEHGDSFIPLGMKGKKKLSDFFIDEKFSIHQKENTFVMVSGTDIIYVIGGRIDDRYKITEKTDTIFQIELYNR